MYGSDVEDNLEISQIFKFYTQLLPFVKQRWLNILMFHLYIQPQIVHLNYVSRPRTLI